MKKLLISLSVFLVVILSGCSNFMINNGGSSQVKNNDSNTNSSDFLPRDQGSVGDEFNDSEEGGEGGAVFCRYVFSNSNDFLIFYDAFKTNNEARFFFPLSDDENIMVNYIFTSEGVDGNDFHNSNYYINYPYPNLKIELTVEDRSTIFITKKFYATYNSMDIFKIRDVTQVDISYSLETQEIIIQIGNQQVAQFQFTFMNYQIDEVEIILEHIKKLFKGGMEYAF